MSDDEELAFLIKRFLQLAKWNVIFVDRRVTSEASEIFLFQLIFPILRTRRKTTRQKNQKKMSEILMKLTKLRIQKEMKRVIWHCWPLHLLKKHLNPGIKINY